MLRRTLQCFLEQEGPFTLKRSVMAKARPVVAHSSGHNVRGDEAGDVRDDSLIDTRSAPQQPQQPKGQLDDASEDAYRFLLHHIDSEIAALKRRITTVAKQRETVESNQTRRIHELFECIERPWLLLDSIPAPQLPNKALEVYAKELYMKQRGPSTANFDQDAVFLDACRRNWRGMTIAQRKPYELAARRNEHMRKELKKKMANGCSHFESFCEQAKEWTAEMARAELGAKPVSRRQAQSQRTSAPTRANRTPTRAPPAVAEAESAVVADVRSSPKRTRTPTRCAGREARKETAQKKTARAVNKNAPTPARVARQRQPKLKPNRPHRTKKAPTPKKNAASRQKKNVK